MRFFQRFNLGAGENDRCALRMQGLGDGAADPARGSGDECDFTCEVEQLLESRHARRHILTGR